VSTTKLPRYSGIPSIQPEYARTIDIGDSGPGELWLPLKSKKAKTCSNDNTGVLTENKEVSHILMKSDPSMRHDSLNPSASPNSLEGVKNLIGFNCDGDNDLSSNGKQESSMEQVALTEKWNKEHKKELDFPDKVELKMEELACELMAPYRSLKYFPNTTQWEGGCRSGLLEKDYDVEMDAVSVTTSAEKMLYSCVASSSYVWVILEGVSQSAYEQLQHNSVLTMVSLLPHENKVPVLQSKIMAAKTSSHWACVTLQHANPTQSQENDAFGFALWHALCCTLDQTRGW
jgi:hypothetical protein